MAPDRIIKYVQKNYRAYWRNDRNLDCQAFGTLLPLKEPALKAEEYSRLTSPKGRTPKRVLRCLENKEVLVRIAQALSCPGLFECRSEPEIDTLMDATVFGTMKRAASLSASDCLLIPQVPHIEKLALHAREEKAIKHLLNQITEGSFNIVCWKDPPAVGSSFIAYALAGSFPPKVGITAVYLIRPFRVLGDPELLSAQVGPPVPHFDEALEALSRQLGLEGRPSPSNILDALKKNRGVLFVLHAELMPQDSRNDTSIIGGLIHEARTNCLRKEGPAPIVLLGEPTIEMPSSRVTVVSDMQNLLAFGNRTARERSDFFEVQWRRFCELRNNIIPDDMGARLKRARQYCSSEVEPVMWPSTIRMLAFFASNYETFSYFDPTAGWERLTCMPPDRLPSDIRLHFEDAVLQLHTVPVGTRQPSLRALRWCSTALYWLTDATVIDLGKMPPRTTLEGFQLAVEKVPQLVQLASQSDGRYKADMALRAVVQDQWVRQDAFGRACVHYQIAFRLFASRDNKDMLYVEFPVEPHWSRSRMQFLAESLRHLMRACDHSIRPEKCPSFARSFTETFPDRPCKDLKGCDPYQVVNFCFANIFWQQLNGNSRNNNIHNRKLSRQHGAYQLTGELLQLISGENRLGEPHWALNPEYTSRYLREVAYAQLDLGDLAGAHQNFQKLIDLPKRPASDPLDTLDYRLDLIVVLAAREEIAAAEDCLKEVIQILEATSPQSDGNSEARRKRQRLETRVAARDARLHYLRGDIEGALAVYRHIEEQWSQAIVRDVAHTYIATLGATGDKQDMRWAMGICIRNLFENTSRGLHHEALGFRVALGHLFRKMGMADVAEVTLDQVYHDILQYGCSERTFLSFLLEAGRTVAELVRFARAYAGYLRPCYDRAKSRGYVRIAEVARRHARECLQRLLVDLGELPVAGAGLREELQGRGDYLAQDMTITIDTQYAFDTDPIERWVHRLETRAALENELHELQ